MLQELYYNIKQINKEMFINLFINVLQCTYVFYEKALSCKKTFNNMLINYLTKKNWELIEYNSNVLKLTLTYDDGTENNILIPKQNTHNWSFYSKNFYFIDSDGWSFNYPCNMKILIEPKLINMTNFAIFDKVSNKQIILGDDFISDIIATYEE